ncbi:MAG: hypothetical protein CV087_08030 [Candidatus Brocadia sp. WS118]|nr:MAG: hypothetical protein CV087_08030 [Candidatus Brocadia sp. WS118]
MAREETLEKARSAQNELGLPLVVTRENIATVNNKYWLTVSIDKKPFQLPLVNVATVEQPLGIAFLNSNNTKNPRLADAMSRHMALLIAAQAPTAVVMPGSNKSEYSIRKATQRASYILGGMDIPLIRLPADRDREKVEHQIGRDGTVISYHPVTLQAGEEKYIGIDAYDLRTLHHLCPNGDGLLIVDDVGTTMATVTASESLLEYEESAIHHVAVFARESLDTGVYPPLLGPRLHTAMFLPEMPFGQEHAEYLFAPQEEPPARVL